MSDEIEQLANLFVVVICAFLILLIIGIVLWANSHIGEVQTRGSAIALADKLMHAPCIGVKDTAGRSIPFFFEKSALDKYNNKNFPVTCIDLPGSMYFIEVHTATDTWTFHSDNIYPYAYNALARGLTRECIKDFGYTSAADAKAGFPNPLVDTMRSRRGGILRYSATVRDGDMISGANVLVIIDPDSGTDYYPKGFPLCLTDVACPNNVQNKCLCLVGDNKDKCVAEGNKCTDATIAC